VTAIKRVLVCEDGHRRADFELSDLLADMVMSLRSPEPFEASNPDKVSLVDFVPFDHILILDDAESAVAVARKSLRLLLSVVTHSGKRSLQTSWVTPCTGPGTPTAYRKPTATPRRI
jgi:hypothetical protein